MVLKETSIVEYHTESWIITYNLISVVPVLIVQKARLNTLDRQT